jgi:two-component system, OmpR family, sensor histidine kinase MprB
MTTTPPEPSKAAESGWLRLPGAHRFPYGKAPNGDQPAGGDAEDELRNEGARAAGEESAAAPVTRARRSPFAAIRAPIARLSLRSRIALLVALAVAMAVAVTSIAAFVTVRNRLHASVDENLLVRAKSAAAAGPWTSSKLTQIPPGFLGAADVRIGMINAAGETASPNGFAPPMGNAEQAVARGQADNSLRTASTDGVEYRVVSVPAAPGIALVVAQPTKSTEDLLDRLGLVLFLVGAAGVGVAAWAGLSIARAGLRPVERLTAAAEHVASTERLEPIEVRGHDELARLATSFNAMLAALSRSRERQQQLVADAGHELRTPLTSLRTNLDLLVQTTSRGGLSDQDREELLADVRAQSEELTVLVQDLVELARDDPAAAQVEELDFAEICERAIDRVKRRAPGLTFEVKLAPWVVRGDATALERAVANILDNAAKWSPAGATVQVRLDGGELQVIDEGPGIPPADLPHVFERFYRATDARRLPGSGLGLAIVKQVADRHGGAVEAARADTGGTQVTFCLPGATST